MQFLRAPFVLLNALLTILACCPASAAPLIAGSYYEDSVGVNCSSTTSCKYWFSQLPSTQLLNLKRVNCSVSGMSQTPIAYKLSVAATSGGASIGRNFYFRVGEIASSGGSYYGAINDELDVLVGSSRFPAIEVDFAVASPVFLVCTIIGDLQDPPS